MSLPFVFRLYYQYIIYIVILQTESSFFLGEKQEKHKIKNNRRKSFGGKGLRRRRRASPVILSEKNKAGWQAVPPVPYIVLPMLSQCRYFNRDGFTGLTWATEALIGLLCFFVLKKRGQSRACICGNL